MSGSFLVSNYIQGFITALVRPGDPVKASGTEANVKASALFVRETGAEGRFSFRYIR
jgi:hypothetical protein